MSIQGSSNDLDMHGNKVVNLDTTFPVTDSTQAVCYSQVNN